MSATSADWVAARCRANRFSRVHEAPVGCFISRTSVCLELHITALNRQVLQASTVESAFLCVQRSIIIKLLLDGSCEGCDIVQSDHAPQAGVAQGIFNGELVRRRVGHQVELEEEQDEEVERRVRRDAQRTRHKCACMDDME